MSGRVTILGVFVADLTLRSDRMPIRGETLIARGMALGPGGKGSNQAVGIARLGAEAHLFARLGDDSFADMAAEVWRAAGVTAHAPRDAQSHTGAACVMVDDKTGDNGIIIAPGAADDLCAEDLDPAIIARSDVFLTQLETPLPAVAAGLAMARERGVRTILNPAPATTLDDALLANVDILTPNETEASMLAGVEVHDQTSAAEAASILMGRGVGHVIVTLGAAGALVVEAGQSPRLVPAAPAGPVVETTGAGDAFNAGLAVAIAEGATLGDAAAFGCRVAGISVTRAGAAASMPHRHELT